MHDRIQQALAHVSPGERLLLAVSGGGDSLAMMKWLASQQGWRDSVVAAHVNHSIRQDAEQVAALAARQANTLGVAFVHAKVDVPHTLAQKNESLEACARRLRYNALESLRLENNCSFIITAHTRDDDAETVLMKLNLSSSWYECTGIPARRGHILRPFLSVTRSELRSLLSTDDVLDEDPMNTQTRFPRVRTRKTLDMDGLAGSAIVERLSQHGQSLRKLLNLSRRLVNTRNNNSLPKSSDAGFGLESLPKNLYLEDLDFLAVESPWARLQGDPDARLTASTRRQVSEFMRGTSRRSKLPLPGGVTLNRAGKKFWLTSNAAFANCHKPSSNPEIIETPAAIFSRSEGHLEISCSNWHVRVWREGERFRPVKRRTRKMADWLADGGVHPAHRNRWPVICCNDRIIAVPGLGVSEQATPTSSGSVISIPWKAKRPH